MPYFSLCLAGFPWLSWSTDQEIYWKGTGQEVTFVVCKYHSTKKTWDRLSWGLLALLQCKQWYYLHFLYAFDRVRVCSSHIGWRIGLLRCCPCAPGGAAVSGPLKLMGVLWLNKLVHHGLCAVLETRAVVFFQFVCAFRQLIKTRKTSACFFNLWFFRTRGCFLKWDWKRPFKVFDCMYCNFELRKWYRRRWIICFLIIEFSQKS